MNKTIRIFFSLLMLLLFQQSYASMARYALTYCKDPNYTCERVQRGDSWLSLFPDDQQRELVQRVNRMNTQIYPGMTIAVPKDLDKITAMDLSPFPRHMQTSNEKLIYVDPNKNAWGAYDASGNLVNWGPASTGRDWCNDIGRACHTVTGFFHVNSKEGVDCFSTKFPVGKGGAPMPYCMFFHGGYALHGSPEVMGYNASHGCVRIFFDDAQWLNENFVDAGAHGTRVEVLPYSSGDGRFDASDVREENTDQDTPPLNNPEQGEPVF